MRSSREQKSLLRRRIILERRSMTNFEIEEKSVIICRKLLENEQFASVNNVLLYLPVNGEVDTKYVLGQFHKKKISIFLPAYLKKGKKWEILKFENSDDLEVGPFGIMQPRRVGIYHPSIIDLAIVPVVAFSKDLNRLGYGKGVYDRLLGGLKTTKVGLAYEFQRVETLPVEPHDVKMDYVVTEKKIYTSKSSST